MCESCYNRTDGLSAQTADFLYVNNSRGLQTFMHFRNNQRIGERRSSVTFYINETFPRNQLVIVGAFTFYSSSNIV